jgi:hypothetical protein
MFLLVFLYGLLAVFLPSSFFRGQNLSVLYMSNNLIKSFDELSKVCAGNYTGSRSVVELW